MRFLYAALHVGGDAAHATHIDPLRWRALYDAFKEIGLEPEPVSVGTFVRAGDVDGLRAVLSSQSHLFIHHEIALRRIVDLLGMEQTLEILRSRNSYLQADALVWKWLDLDAEAILPAFRGIGVAGALAAQERGYDHIQLGCQRLPTVFNDEANAVVYVGRYHAVFNDRTRAIADVLREIGMVLRFVTYKDHQAALDPILPECPNISVHDPVPYARLSEAVGAARFGLAFRRHNDPNGKVWDYLAMGLPVLYENLISESEFLSRTGAGIGFARKDHTGLKEAIGAFIAPDMAALREQNSWAVRAKEWAAVFARG